MSPRGLNPNARTVTCKKIRELIAFRKQNGRCAVGLRGRGIRCLMGGILNKHAYEIDHIHEFVDGGRTEMSNLQALCPGCHKRKSGFMKRQRIILRTLCSLKHMK